MRVPRFLFLLAFSVFTLTTGWLASSEPKANEQKWVASWTTPISGPLEKVDYQKAFPHVTPAILMLVSEFRQPDFDYALPQGEASNQSFRMIVRPDLWGATVRVRFSNVFGSQSISLGAASIGLQESGGNLQHGTSTQITFGGKPSITIPRGREVVSDAVHLQFVTEANKLWLRGRNLAVSFEVSGKSGLLSTHASAVTSYLSRPNAGNHTGDEGDLAFPYTTNSFFLIKEVDILADSDTAVVCALGDSITDERGATLNGYDGWADDLSTRAHRLYGDKVSIVNMGISGNTVVTTLKGPGDSDPVVKRLDRDVLRIAGLTSVVWLEGINDIGSGQSKPGPLIEGYKRVVARLHARGIAVIGATLTPSLWPKSSKPPAWPWTADEKAAYGGARINSYREQINAFIRTSGLFDSVADMASVTEDRATGALYEDFQSGDHLHPNRAGHLAMATTVDLKALVLPVRSTENR